VFVIDVRLPELIADVEVGSLPTPIADAPSRWTFQNPAVFD
jgi:hypothetical protein